MKCPKCGYVWGDGWVFAGAVNFPCVMHNYPYPMPTILNQLKPIFIDNVEIQFYDRVLTYDEIEEIMEEWIKSEEKLKGKIFPLQE